MIEAAETALQFVEGSTYADFSRNKKDHFATIRALEILGEAAKRVPVEIRHRYPAIAWGEIARMRDKLIHHYTKVNLKVVWRTATEDLPILLPQLRKVLDTQV